MFYSIVPSTIPLLALATVAMSRTENPTSLAANRVTSTEDSTALTSYSITFTGPSTKDSTSWGVSTASSEVDESSEQQLYRIKIGFDVDDDVKADDIVETPKQRVINTGTDVLPKLYINNNSTEELFLGLDYNLTATTPNSGDVLVPTVPFGLNPGFRGNWNGSLALNGYYDANRISSESWIPLQFAAPFSQSDFLNAGLITFNGRLRSAGQENTLDARVTLHFSLPYIQLPRSFACSNLTIEPVGASPTYPIAIPDYLISSGERCKVRDDDEAEDGREVVLAGMPFFQAIYSYVERNDDVYIAQANDYDLPPRPAKFEANQTLAPPPRPADYQTPTSAGVTRGCSLGIVIALCTLSTVFSLC